jgi:hypothetical protein
MPQTASLGCGTWGGNITSENISVKHYMNTTWVSRRSRRQAERAGTAGRVLQFGNLRRGCGRCAEPRRRSRPRSSRSSGRCASPERD